MFQVAISDDFLTAYAQLPKAQQKKVREFVTRFRADPTVHSINYEPVHDARDRRVRTVRIDLSYRAIILHPDQGNTYLLAWVDHHDEAMDWARKKQFDVNPVTGALQMVDTIATQAMVEEIEEKRGPETKALSEYVLFETFSDNDLCIAGLPEALIPAVRALKTAEELEELKAYLPREAYEALWWIANFGYSVKQALNEVAASRPAEPVDTEDIGTALEHPDSQRRFAVIRTTSELQEMLNAPMEKWRVFLHPSQARVVKRQFNGPARVLGGAGTGKTVVAMHRVRYLAAEIFNKPTDRILFTTYTRNLANNIEDNLRHLCGPELERIEVVNLHRWAVRFLRSQGFSIDIADYDEVDQCWEDAFSAIGTGEWSEDFYFNEWDYVVKANSITSKREYLRVPRRGQRKRLSRPQRAAVWEVFVEFQRNLDALGKIEWMDVITQARLYLEQKGDILPYRAVVVDETQDLFPEELRLIRQLVPEGPNDIFLVGDAHQRIYARPIVLSHCGINIRGRSSKLRINYRTTEEIRNWAVSVLTGLDIDDLDGGIDDLIGYTSLLHGIPPTIEQFSKFEEEQDYLTTAVRSLLLEEVPAETICVVSRSKRQLSEYMEAFAVADLPTFFLDRDTRDDAGDGVRFATMHRVKGLEFAHVLIAGVNEGVIPPNYNGGEPPDEDQILLERCLLHVASSRARDTLTITSYGKPSPFLAQR